MTDRAEIERLLNQTGRTLDGLPEQYSSWAVKETVQRVGRTVCSIGNMLLHQSDVIELLIGALRDALNVRDAAVKDIPRACCYCKHYNNPPRIEEGEHGILVTYCEKECYIVSGINTAWEWRGVQPKEDGHENA